MKRNESLLGESRPCLGEVARSIMKKTKRIPCLLRFLCWGVVGPGAVLLGASLQAQSSAGFPDRLRIDGSDIDRRGHLPTTFAPVLKDVLPAIVSVSTARVTWRRTDPVWDEILRRYLGEDYVPAEREERCQQGLGSGVLVTGDGLIITNYHVIQGADEITVTLPQSGSNYEAAVIAADRSTDVALLKIEGQDFQQATLADSDLVEVGDVVLAVGNPFELAQTVTQGIVSAKGRSNVAPQGFYGSFIQTDAAINPGNSGGALVDASGRVLGINTMIYSTTGGSTGIGFAIPINTAIRVIKDLLDKGHVPRGYLGVVLNEVSSALARRLGRPDLKGAVVGPVIQDSPAGRAGLRQYDLIVEFDGRGALDGNSLRLAIGRLRPGSEVTLGVVRNGRFQEIPVTLGETSARGSYVNRDHRWDRRDGGDAGALGGVEAEGNPTIPGEAVPFYLEGIETVTLDDALRDQLGLDASYEGAVVVQAHPGSPAARRGLRVGDLIVEVGRQPVRTSAEAVAAGRGVEGDSVILGLIRRGKEEFVLVTRQEGRGAGVEGE